MSIRRSFDKYETVLLLEYCIKVLNKELSRETAIASISYLLRSKALKQGLVIDTDYRSYNGIASQFSRMHMVLKGNVKNEKTVPKLFIEIYKLYLEDRIQYETILKEAKEMIDMEKTAKKDLKKDFYNWLSKKVSPDYLSYCYKDFQPFEHFCFLENLLTCDFFETTDLNTLEKVRIAVLENDYFKNHMKLFIEYYIEYVKLFYKSDISQDIGAKAVPKNYSDNSNTAINQRDTLQPKPMKKSYADLLERLCDETGVEYADKRCNNSCLWILDSEKTKVLVDVFERYLGCSLIFAKNGGFSTGNRPAWWTTKKIKEENYPNIPPVNELVEKILNNFNKENLLSNNSSINEVPAKKPSQNISAEAVKENFMTWLRDKVSDTQLSDLYMTYETISKFCAETKILEQSIFQVTDIDEVKSTFSDIKKSKKFRFMNKRKMNKIDFAMGYYIYYLEETNQPTIERKIEKKKSDRTYISRDKLVNIVLEQQRKKFANHEEKDRIDEKVLEEYSTVLEKYFAETGFKIGNSIFQKRFKNYYFEEFGKELSDSKEKIDELVKRAGTERDGRIYPKHNSQNQLISEIVDDVFSTLDGGASAICNEALFEKYQKALSDNLQIYNTEALVDLVLKNSNGRLRQKRSCLTYTFSEAKFEKDIINFLRKCYPPLTIEKIHDMMWYIMLKRIKATLSASRVMVNTSQGCYFYAPNLPVSKYIDVVRG